MQKNAWMEPGFLGVKPGGCPRNPHFDMDDTENPSPILRGGILAGTEHEQSGGIG